MRRFFDGDITYSFLRSPAAIVAGIVTLSAMLVALFAPWIAPFDPFDPSQISLWDGKLPPAWIEGGQPQYLLGTDNQGRDMLSTIIYGGRLSIIIGLAAVRAIWAAGPTRSSCASPMCNSPSPASSWPF